MRLPDPVIVTLWVVFAVVHGVLRGVSSVAGFAARVLAKETR